MPLRAICQVSYHFAVTFRVKRRAETEKRRVVTVPPGRAFRNTSPFTLAECVSRHVARSTGMKMDEEREDLTTRRSAT